MANRALCIYHDNCADGFGAAWAVHYALGNRVEFHAATYGTEPPDVTGRTVYIVDFSYSRAVLLAMAAEAKCILVLDHHKTASEALVDLPTNVRTVFDMERSGARITWDHFFPGIEPPVLLQHIEDRDLWRFRLPLTRDVQAALFSYPYDFATWTSLMQSDVDALAHDGAAIERKHHKDVAELVAVTRRRMTIGGRDVPVANLPYTMSSDACCLMAKGEPFAACYWDTKEHRVFSLRSTEDGADVSEIAKQYGGGGHRNAAGFRIPRQHAASPECGETPSMLFAEYVRGRNDGWDAHAARAARVLTCVYCGTAYAQDTPTYGDKVLTDHIKTCDKHPLRQAEATIQQLRSALVGLIGESDVTVLKAMEVELRKLPGIEADRAAAINAVHAILATVPEQDVEVAHA